MSHGIYCSHFRLVLEIRQLVMGLKPIHTGRKVQKWSESQNNPIFHQIFVRKPNLLQSNRWHNAYFRLSAIHKMQRSIFKTKIEIFFSYLSLHWKPFHQKYGASEISKRAHKSDLYELRINWVQAFIQTKHWSLHFRYAKVLSCRKSYSGVCCHLSSKFVWNAVDHVWCALCMCIK